ncbi:TPA: hypothetical protein P7Z52_000759 [Klebsiella pneumoniae]|uniref:hypothetical protein n=1 Tax=Klebsiella pneumoniae TaxID=573 RepID=UPI00298A2A4D|nr:hypothetical protein [Klebsiella variicola]HBX9880783.1 hypothetical protein [Klebsiella pneumoniae]HDQ2815255.1 hypothetical protein [Klebsiella pneumoniae]
MNDVSNLSVIYEIDDICQGLYGIYDEIKEHLKITDNASTLFIKEIGHNSESSISRELFSDQVIKSVNPNILYIQDCEALIIYIQECCLEIGKLESEFTKMLSSDFGIDFTPGHYSGVNTYESPQTTLVFSLLSSLFIKMSSLLDYITKIAFEILHCPLPIDKYRKLISRDKLYGKYRELPLEMSPGTIFESTPLINTIISIRDHIIHHGYIDEHPKVYHVINNGICTNKFILMPDFNESGRLENCVNRTLFYSKEIKFNEKLPIITHEILQRACKSIKLIIENYEIQKAS